MVVRDDGSAGKAGRFFNAPGPDAGIVACPHCDLLQGYPSLTAWASVRCPRCYGEIGRHRPDAFVRMLALALAASVLYVVANATPMLGLSAAGRAASTTVIGGVHHLWNSGEAAVAVLVLWTAVVAPALQIGFALAIVLGVRWTRPPRWVGILMRYHRLTVTWSMIEVMLLGVLVALIKIADYAAVIPGAALYFLGALVFVLAAMQANVDRQQVWRRVVWAEDSVRSAGMADMLAEATR
ncbi:paraquat-inducible protein A [Candidatus Binatia bacterium]|nr:paraquat-inducible protein A [Candidatus Binatia bacterium]